MRISFHNLGCKVNSYESIYVSKLFEEANYVISDFNDICDIYIINTCTVTNQSDVKSRKIIREAVKRGENAIVVVMGCYSQIKYLEASKIPGVSIVIGTNNKSKIIDLIEEYKQTKKQKCPR